MDAIKYVTEVANLKYRIEENAVIITPVSAAVVSSTCRPASPSRRSSTVAACGIEVTAAELK